MANGTATFGLGMIGGLLLWVAFPPCAWWPCAWLAPVAWVLLVCRKRLPGARPYFVLWCVGWIHWLLILHWVRLPHWSAFFGWFVLAGYLACYVPLFIGLSRAAVHQAGIPTVVVVPVVWTGLELLRGHFLTGFSLALLGHTQATWTTLIQVADVGGAYAVSCLMMFVAASLAVALPRPGLPAQRWPLAVAGLILVCVLGYGRQRLDQALPETAKSRGTRVALVQGSIDVSFSHDQRKETLDHYLELSQQALVEHPDLDVIVWPESMCTFDVPIMSLVDDLVFSPDFRALVAQNAAHVQQRIDNFLASHRAVTSTPAEKSAGKVPSFILCSETIHWRDKLHRFNTALLIDPAGTIINRYHKMHPVMFGEYVPLGGIFPWLYNLTPMAGGLTPGEEPKLFEVAGLRLAPSICFETTVPHLIRRQVIELRRQGRVPDALVNLTNDGWFWGSSELDLHLVCGVFRAIENRLPLLIAANTGFSAWIGAEGRVITRGPRRARDILVANLQRSANHPTAVLGSPYQHVGDLLAGACLLFCGLVVLSLVPGLLCRVVSGSSLHDS